MGPTPTDPVEFRECARDVRTWSAAKKHTNEEQGGSRDLGVRRPGAGRGQLPARSKIFRAAIYFVVCYAATQLALQFQQEHIQMVRSSKVVRRLLTESNGTPAIGAWNQSCSQVCVCVLPRSFLLTLFIFKAPNYVLARTLTERVV